MKPTLPILSITGFTSNNSLIMTKLYEYFLTSEYSQSNFYRGKIASLKWILANYDEIVDVKAKIKSTLEIMYGNYFNNVNVIVDAKIDDTDTIVEYIINIVANDDEGEEYVLSNAMKISDNKILNMEQIISELYV